MGSSIPALQSCISLDSSESLIPVEEKSSLSLSLKRKRPPKIQIPNVLKEISIDTQFKLGCSPVKNDCICSFEDLGVGVYSIKGKKKFMEDTHKIVSSINGNSKKGFFGVYDGHGGRKAAEFVAERLHKNLLEMLDNNISVGNKAKEEAVKAAYLKTDKEFLEQGVGSGACCVTVLIEGTEMVVSNLGDCRAVLCRGCVAEPLTMDHRVEMQEERKRIENKGGYVEFHKGAWRVHGILAVSRSIGDSHLKDWVVSEPDTAVLDLTPNMDFLILASDGLWDEVGNQEAIDIVLQSCVTENKAELPQNDLENINQRSAKENDDEYACVSTSSSPKVKRVSLMMQKQKTTLSPSCRKTEHICAIKDSLCDFDSENESPVTKLRRTSLFAHKSMITHSPRSEIKRPASSCKMKTTLSPRCRKIVENTCTVKDGLSDFDSENESPPAKLRRTSLFAHKNMITQSPRSENKRPDSSCINKTTLSPCCTVKDGISDFDSENGSTAQLRRTLLFEHKKVTQSPRSEIKKPASEGLVTACKKLVNLAVSRGSMDDITVMLIDLKHFRSGT